MVVLALDELVKAMAAIWVSAVSGDGQTQRRSLRLKNGV
jgi:hypothetical protein